MEFNGRHIVSLRDLSKEDLLKILSIAKNLEEKPQPDLLSGFLMATLFFEPSTRTRLSFEAAMSRLGGRVIGFADANSTSQKKGESLADTIRMAEQYADVIVMRHPHDGAARLATEVSGIPIINGGDGSNQHPTQTCLDLYTINKLFPNLIDDSDQLTVAFAGDLRYGRTVHSLFEALLHFNVKILTIAPKGLELPESFTQKATAKGITVTVVETLQEAAEQSDILYMTRLQEERFPDPVEFDHVKSSYRLNARMLKNAKESLRILHPLPRVNEIATDVDETEHAHYFPQAGNGIPVRQALLALVLGKIS